MKYKPVSARVEPVVAVNADGHLVVNYGSYILVYRDHLEGMRDVKAVGREDEELAA